MEKLNFPVFDDRLMPPPIASMDEYVTLMDFFLRDPINPKREAEEKNKVTVVNVPFRLK